LWFTQKEVKGGLATWKNRGGEVVLKTKKGKNRGIRTEGLKENGKRVRKVGKKEGGSFSIKAPKKKVDLNQNRAQPRKWGPEKRDKAPNRKC